VATQQLHSPNALAVMELSLEVAETVRGKAMVIDPAVDDVTMET